MAEKELFGLPKIIINFKTRATTAITRSARGIGVIILNEADAVTMTRYDVSDVSDIPTLSYANVDLIKKALLGTPLRLIVYVIPPAKKTIIDGETQKEVASEIQQADVLKELADAKWNYICHPTGSAQEQSDLSSWVKSQRANRAKTFKAIVANVAADSYGVINFTTSNIKTINPLWQDALDNIGDEDLIPASTTKYITYTTAQYTARILGILCGLSLDRSATYYELDEVLSCGAYDDIDAHINDGELVLFDEHDGHGVKIGRGCNSLKTFTTDFGQDFRFIKIVEAIDMIHDDIAETFRDEYVGKVINDYNHKMLLISAIHVYFSGLKGNILDASDEAESYVEIDTAAQRSYATLRGEDTTLWSDAKINQYNTGVNVYLRGRVSLVNAMETLTINFTL